MTPTSSPTELVSRAPYRGVDCACSGPHRDCGRCLGSEDSPLRGEPAPLPGAAAGRARALHSLRVYAGRIRLFDARDWWVYAGWVGMMLGLVASTSGFLWFGHSRGVQFPAEAWLVPAGASVFALSIALDTIGHRTIYKAEIQRAEGLVHGITILCGILSCVGLCAAYSYPGAFWVPAMVFTGLSVIYSLVDEAFHWRRYVQHHSDPVEMWSHVGILVGHSTMMLAWWAWFFQGYPGVSQTLAELGAR